MNGDDDDEEDDDEDDEEDDGAAVSCSVGFFFVIGFVATVTVFVVAVAAGSCFSPAGTSVSFVCFISGNLLHTRTKK